MSRINFGIVLLALERPLYGRLAYNLANSLKLAEPSVPICLVHSGQGLASLAPEQKVVFDTLQPCPPQLLKLGDRLLPGRVKCALPQLSPYQHTLFLDADSLWFRQHKPSELQARLGHTGFAAQSWNTLDPARLLGHEQILCWANAQQACQALNLSKPLHCFSSYFLYWTRCKAAFCLFDTALELYDRLTLGQLQLGHTPWQGSVPDELPLCLASSLAGVAPSPSTFTPVLDLGNTPLQSHTLQLSRQYCALTLPGNAIHSQWLQWYNALVKENDRHTPRGTRFLWQNKSQAL